MEIIDKIKKAYQKGDLLEKAICLTLFPIKLSNNEIQALQIRYKNYSYLNRKYGSIVKNFKFKKKIKDDRSAQDVIWICWLQGIENAPLLVSRCVDSVIANNPNKKVIMISIDNVHDYIELPSYILEKWRIGIINNAHLSDIIRTELLIRYGGLWVDATVFMTGQIPEYVYSCNFFLYAHAFPDDITMTFNNWFIYSEKDNDILVLMRKLLYAYWEKESKSKEYFVWHLFMTMIVNEKPDLFEEMPYITDELPETLARVCFRSNNKNFLSTLTQMTPVHKLSTKLIVPENIKGTYYESIINGTSNND